MSVAFREENRLTLLRSGAEYFPALEAAIEEAQYAIHLETYIFAERCLRPPPAACAPTSSSTASDPSDSSAG